MMEKNFNVDLDPIGSNVRKSYAKCLKAIFVLFGKGNCGKTTTLRLLIDLLSSSQQLPQNKADVRVIVEYKGKYIYISTYGDVKEEIYINHLFFEGRYDNSKILLFQNKEKMKTGVVSSYYKEYPPSIYVSASRRDGETVIANLSFATAKTRHICKYEWLLKNAENPSSLYNHNNPSNDDWAMAKHLKDLIDKVIDNKLIP